MAAQTQSTQMRNGQLGDDPAPLLVGNVADSSMAQAHAAAADLATEQLQELMVQLVRQGLDASLRLLQLWADLARQLGATTPGTPGAAMMVSVAYDMIEKSLTAQREVVDELVDNQCQFAQQFFGTTLGVAAARRSQ